jgi:hypothetical protein
MLNISPPNKVLASTQSIRPRKRKRDKAREHIEPSVRRRHARIAISVPPTTDDSPSNPRKVDPKGFYNRRGDQYLEDGIIFCQERKYEFAPEFARFPEPGQGYANLEGMKLHENGQPVFKMDGDMIDITDDDDDSETGVQITPVVIKHDS